MKACFKIILLFIISISVSVSQAQVAINTDGSSADASAILDVKSTEKGLLLPRLTVVQRDNINSPAMGLLIFNTSTKKLNFFNGIDWESIESTSSENVVIDYDGNVYNIVVIGDQAWMAEDLRVTHYPNGDPIPNITDNTEWANLGNNNTDDAYCFYDNNSYTDYGALYTYAAAIGDNWIRINAEGQGVCPDGWHLPSVAEYETLANYLGGSSIAGGKLKESGFAHWDSPNTGATNETNFSALPAGMRVGTSFLYQGLYAYFRTADEYTSVFVNIATIHYNSGSISPGSGTTAEKNKGFQVRCIKNN